MGWEDIVKTVAPTLASCFGSPLAGIATKALVDGLLPDGNESDLESLTKNAYPKTLAKIKEIEAKFKTDMARAGIDLEKIHSGDRKSARSLFGVNAIPQVGLTIVFVSGFFAILILLILYGSDLNDIPEWLQGTLNNIIGAILGSVLTIMTFWFGSSKGSQDKDKRII